MRKGINERQTKVFYGLGQCFFKILRVRAKWRLERDRGPQRGSQALREDNNLKVLMLAVYTENRDRGTQVS